MNPTMTWKLQPKQELFELKKRDISCPSRTASTDVAQRHKIFTTSSNYSQLYREMNTFSLPKFLTSSSLYAHESRYKSVPGLWWLWPQQPKNKSKVYCTCSSTERTLSFLQSGSMTHPKFSFWTFPLSFFGLFSYNLGRILSLLARLNAALVASRAPLREINGLQMQGKFTFSCRKTAICYLGISFELELS